MTRPNTMSKLALLSAVSSAALLAVGSAQAQLGTPTIISGTADAPVIMTDGGTPGRTLSVDITQTSDRLVIHWDNMDIANDQSVNFNQATSDIAVNRITGGSVDGTTIDGILSAGGQVWVIDPNGVTFGANANVDVNGLLATTADFADVNDPDTIGFLAENNAFVFGGDVTLIFDVEGTPGATIDTTALDGANVNGGISAGEGGVKFIADGINHQGLIETTVPMGVVELVGSVGDGTQVFSLTVDASNGAGLVQVPVSTDASTVELAGRIAALGGTVRITAAGASAEIQNVASAGTVIEADTITMQSDGTISLTNAANDFTGTVDADGASVELTDANGISLGDIDTAGALTVTAGGLISDGAQGSAGDDIDVGGATTLSAGGAVLLNDATHDFGGSVDADGSSITLTDINGIALGDIDAAVNLVVTAGGSITDGAQGSAGDDIDVGGTTTLSAGGAVVLNDATHDFGGSVDADGTSITLTDIDGIELGDIDTAGALTVTSINGTITDGAEGSAGDDIDVGGATILLADGAITLDDATHDFGGSVDADGTSITLTDINDIELGDIDTAGALLVTSIGGSITDGAGNSINAGDATFVALTDNTSIAIDNSANDFSGALTVNGHDITLDLQGTDPTIASIVASGVLNYTDNATITGANLSVAETATLTSTLGSVELVTGQGVFGGAINAIAPGASGSITIDLLGDRTISALAGTAGSTNSDNTVDVTTDGILTIARALGDDVTLEGSSLVLRDLDVEGSLVADATSGSITDDAEVGVGSDVDVVETSTLTAVTDIILDDTTNNFGGLVTATSTNGGISIADRNALSLAAIAGVSGSISAANTIVANAAGALTLSSALGYTVDATGSSVSLGQVDVEQDAGLTPGSGDLTVVATTGSIDDDTAGDLTIAGDASFDALGANTSIVIDETGNVFSGTVSADGDDVTFAFSAAQILGVVRATGDLIVSAIGALSGGPLDVDGTTDLTSSGGSITFVDNANSFDGLVTVDAGTSIDLSTLGALNVQSSGGTTTLDGASITITSLQASSLDADATGDITGGSATVTGLTTLDSTSGVINLTGNTFQGQVTATAASAAGSVTLANTTELDVIATAGAGGALTSANVIDVSSSGQLTVTGFANAVTAAGSGVVLNDINAQTDNLGLGGTLKVTASTGGVTDIGILLVEGTTDVTAATDIILDNGANDFGGLVTAMSSSGDVTIVDASALTVAAAGSSIDLSGTSVELNDIDASGGLTVTAASGSIDDGVTTSNDADINVAGDTTLTATSTITLDDVTNDFQGAVSASGTSVVLADADDLELGDIDTAGDLTVTVVTGSISDGAETSAGNDIDVGGNAVFTVSNPLDGSVITIDDLTNVFNNLVSATGFDVIFAFLGDQVLGTVTAVGDLSVEASGDLTGGALIVAGTSDLSSTAGSVAFTDDANVFGGQVTAAAAQNINLSGNGPLTVQADAGGDVSLTSDSVAIVSASGDTVNVMASGAITGGSVAVAGAATLTSVAGAIDLSGNTFEGRVTALAAGDINLSQSGDLSVEASGSAITLSSDGLLETTVSGTDVSLSGGSVTLETVTATQALTVVSGNAITGGTVDVANGTSLIAEGDIDLTSTSNLFGTELSAQGAHISIGTTGDLVLGLTDAKGDLSVETDGSISDGTSPILVTGQTTMMSGGDIVLDNASNDFGGALSASGSSIHIADANSLVLGDIVADGDFRVVFDADRSTSPDQGVQLTDETGTTIMVAGMTDISTGLASGVSILSDSGGPSINLDNASHRFADGLALRRIGGSAFLSEMADPSETALVLRNLEVGSDLTIQTGRSITLVGRLTAEDNGVFGLDPVLTNGQPSDTVVANQGVDGLDEASFHLFVPDGATWTFDTTAGGASEVGADVRFDRPIDSLGELSLSVDDIALRQEEASETGALSISAGSGGEVRFRDYVGANRPLGLVRVLSAGSAFLGSTRATSPENEEDDAFLMAERPNPVSNAELNLRDFFYAASLTFEDVRGNAQVLVPSVHADNGFEFFGINVTGANGRFEGGPLDGRAISGFVFGGTPQFLEVFGGIAPVGGDLIRGASAGLIADGLNISARTTFNGCQIGDTSTCINLDIPVVVTAPQNTLTIDTVAMDDPNDSNFLAFGNEQLWANPPTFFILAPLPAATEE